MSKSYERIVSKQFDSAWEYDEAKRQQRKEDRKKRDMRRNRNDQWQSAE